ncbi:hypothetical protein IAU59_003336 [Kwoniella sp. CBS 9459]
MKFTSTLSALAFIGAAVAQQTSGDITVNTPASVVQCQPASLSWSGGKAPYIVAIIPGGQASAAAISTVDDAAQGTSLTWTVDVQAGTSISIKLTDADGNIQYSSPLDVQSGSSDSCLNGGGSSASGSASSGGSSASATSSGAASSPSMGTGPGASDISSSAAASATSAAGSATGSASRTTQTSTAGASTVTGSSSASASGASGSASASASASAGGGDSGAMSQAGIAAPAVVLAIAGGIAALF